jgi:hypothetical protein
MAHHHATMMGFSYTCSNDSTNGTSTSCGWHSVGMICSDWFQLTGLSTLAICAFASIIIVFLAAFLAVSSLHFHAVSKMKPCFVEPNQK